MRGEALESLLYRSRATQRVGGMYLLVFMMRAQANNRRYGITGRLCYNDGQFIQYLEGPANAVRHVWQAIQRDTRHDDIRILHREPCMLERRLPSWPLALTAEPRFGLYQIPDFSHDVCGDMNDLFIRCGLPSPSDREQRRWNAELATA
jgi:hypothetical protein